MKRNKNIDLKTVEKVASLAKLALKKGEDKKFQGQLSQVFDYAGKVSEIKTSGAKGTSQVVYGNNRFRKDEINATDVLSQKEALSQSKRNLKGFFVVDAVITE